MTLIYCPTPGTLAGPDYWLSDKPFDYAWGRFGCNHLRCGACGQLVKSYLDEARPCRHYECACQSRDEYGFHVIGADSGLINEFVTAWRCDGHPRLQLPAELDGIAIPADGPLAPIVDRTLADPPFVPPGVDSPAFWVRRLYHVVSTARQQVAIGDAVAAQLSGADPRMVEGAIDFFLHTANAPGADQLAVVAQRDRERLRTTPQPSYPSDSLYKWALEAIERRLMVVDKDGGPVSDRGALDLACAALLAGDAGPGLIFRVAARAPSWFCEHAADIVRARPDQLGLVLQALKDKPGRAAAIEALQSIDEAMRNGVRDWLERHPS